MLDNHLHVLVRLDTDIAAGWSDEEVVRRWGRLFPPRDKSRQPLPVTEHWVAVATARRRVGRDSTHATGKPELVHEMLERTTLASGQ